ncbi:MAG: electron transfer flavoprotein subunit alpha/FixB family protein, partial [Saprospiraceae bacterium]
MVLVFAESPRGHFKKAAFEAVTYGKKVAELLGTTCAALTLGTNVTGAEELGNYGAARVLQLADAKYDHVDSHAYAAAIAAVARQNDATVIILSHTSTGKAIAGRLSIRLQAGLVTGVNSLLTVNGNTLHVKKSVFSGKAIAEYEISSPVKIISLLGNAIRPETMGTMAKVEGITADVSAGRIKVKEVKTLEG